jgi:Na+-driven multidrug efflux pump
MSLSNASRTNEILNSNLMVLMVKLATPGILGMLLIGLNTFIDALFAGQLIGKTALAAISLAAPLTAPITGSALMIGVGSASVLSRAIGAGDTKTQANVFSNLVILAIIVSLPITLLSYYFSESLITFMGGTGEIATYGANYLRTYAFGSVFFILAVASSQLIKAEGKITLATIFSSIFVITNIILNFIFVDVLRWQIQGIAIATVIAMLIYTIVNFTYFLSGRSSITVPLVRLKLTISLVPQTLSIGLSVLIAQVFGFIQQALMFRAIADYGTSDDVAFCGATFGIYSLAIVPIYGLVQTLQPVIGINYGAGQYRRLKAGFLIFVMGGTVFATLIWLLLQCFPDTFLGLLLPDFKFSASHILNFRLINLLLPSVSFVWCGVVFLQAIGNAKLASLLIILRQLILFIPILWIFTPLYGVHGVYYSFLLVDLLTLLITSFLLTRDFKNLNQKGFPSI